MKVLVIIPAYNEEESIEKVVDNLVEHFPQYDYVVVNDGSKDSIRSNPECSINKVLSAAPVTTPSTVKVGPF